MVGERKSVWLVWGVAKSSLGQAVELDTKKLPQMIISTSIDLLVLIRMGFG